MEQSLVNFSCSGRSEKSLLVFTQKVSLYSWISLKGPIFLSTFLVASTFFRILIRLQVSPIPPRLTLHTCPRLLRGDWAVWRKELCEELPQWFHLSKWKTLSTFLFLCPSDLLSQSNGPSKKTFSTFTKIEHHNFCIFVPFTIRFVSVSSIPLLFKSRPQKRPLPQREFSSIISNSKRIRNANFSVSLFAPFTVVIHQHEDDPSLEVLKLTLQLSNHLWISATIPNVVTHGKLFHSDSIRSRRFHPIICNDVKWFLPDTALNRKRHRFCCHELNVLVSTKLSFATFAPANRSREYS